MTLDEKVAQMQAAAPAIPRLGVTAYNWWNEGLHGLARNGYATVFPQAIGLAASWDVDLIQAVGDTVSTQARAGFNALGAAGDHGRYQGLTIWSPNINIFRDPRWGRGQETYGEDPYLTGTLATAFVKGLQGPDSSHPKSIATLKHFAVHSGPEAGRHGFDVDPSPYDLEATYLPAFRQAVTSGGVGSVMCAYNALHGVPACANANLLQTHLRDAWGFTGYVVTDCDSVQDMFEFHFYRPTQAEAAAEALKAGTDLNCGAYYAFLAQAVREGRVPESLLDTALTRLWAARRRLGLDGVGSPYDKITPDQIHSPQASALALKAARESIVLLKNDGVLPLKRTAKLAVIGPNADSLEALEANYHGVAVHPITPLVGLRALWGVDHVSYAQGATIAASVPLPVPETALRTPTGEKGLLADYYATPDFTGAPVKSETEQTVNLDLYNARPFGLPSKGPYSVRWTGKITPPSAGDYVLNIYMERCWECDNHHDNVRLYIDGKPVIVDAGDGKHLSADLHFADAAPHDLRLDFAHVGEDWGVRLQWLAPAQAQIAEALRAAADSDAIIALVGLSPDIEGEELSILVPGFDRGDRTDLALPQTQADMLQALKATGKPLVVVVMSGGPVSVAWAQTHANAVIQAWYPGEAGGTAIAATLSGQNNPSGRLPVTVYASVQDLPPFVDYRMTGRTYRYFTGKPLYPFGYGLSYTRFAYSRLNLSTDAVQAGQDVQVSATVTNTGAVAGDEVAQLYLTPPENPQGLRRELAGFTRVHLEPGESRRVSFTLDPRRLSLVNSQGERSESAGAFGVFVGGGQPEFSVGVEGRLSLSGSMILPK
jgi:beta-glucosidase